MGMKRLIVLPDGVLNPLQSIHGPLLSCLAFILCYHWQKKLPLITFPRCQIPLGRGDIISSTPYHPYILINTTAIFSLLYPNLHWPVLIQNKMGSVQNDRFGTLAVHAGSPHDPATGAVIAPVSQISRTAARSTADKFLDLPLHYLRSDQRG